jgi:hypothetical protein
LVSAAKEIVLLQPLWGIEEEELLDAPSDKENSAELISALENSSEADSDLEVCLRMETKGFMISGGQVFRVDV